MNEYSSSGIASQGGEIKEDPNADAELRNGEGGGEKG
jgi:hypothetical protein